MEIPPKGAIEIETILPASVEKVWQAWTVPNIILQWFGSDPNGKGIAAVLNVQPGGAFQITFADANGTVHTCSGTYTIVEEFSKLNFTWEWKSEPGVVSFVTIILTPEGDNTQMNFTHADLGNESKHDYLNGWNATFLKLKTVLDKSR